MKSNTWQPPRACANFAAFLRILLDMAPANIAPSHPLAGMGITPTGEVTGEVERLLRAMSGEMPRQQIQEALVLKHEDHFRNAYLKPALTLGVIEMTLPEKPRSSNQRYRLTALGHSWLEKHPSARKIE